LAAHSWRENDELAHCNYVQCFNIVALKVRPQQAHSGEHTRMGWNEHMVSTKLTSKERSKQWAIPAESSKDMAAGVASTL
jgi:hypothetical protein